MSHNVLAIRRLPPGSRLRVAENSFYWREYARHIDKAGTIAVEALIRYANIITVHQEMRAGRLELVEPEPEPEPEPAPSAPAELSPAGPSTEQPRKWNQRGKRRRKK